MFHGQGNFRKLLPVLATRHLSPRIRDKVYKACVRSAVLHGSKMWGPNTTVQRLCCNDCAICTTKDHDKTHSASLVQKLGIEDILAVLRSWRLRWYGHVEHTTSCIKSGKTFRFPATEGEEGQNTWSECVNTDVTICGLAAIDP